MSKKQEFISYVNELIVAAPDVVPSEDAKAYWEGFTTTDTKEKPALTDNGKIVLKTMQDNLDVEKWKAKDVSEKAMISPRTASGAMRKLVLDNFVEKISDDPCVYVITEKGKNFKID